MTTDAYDAIRREVHVRIDRRRLRPEVDLDEVRVEVERDGRRVPARARCSVTQLPLADAVGAWPIGCCGRSPSSAR